MKRNTNLKNLPIPDRFLVAFAMDGGKNNTFSKHEVVNIY